MRTKWLRFEAQISSCEDCRQELETLRPVVQSFVGWSAEVSRPAESLWNQLSKRIATEDGTQPFVPPSHARLKPEWEEAALLYRASWPPPLAFFLTRSGQSAKIYSMSMDRHFAIL